MSISAATSAPSAAQAAPVSRYAHLLEWSLFAGLLAWNFLACCFPLTDFDFWWHLRTGELIWQRGAVPDLDWFTYTNADRPWVDLHWGFQLLQALLYHTGGANLVVLFKAAMVTLALAIGYLAAGRGLPAWIRVLAWSAPVITLSGRVFERPEMLSLVFLALWMWILPRIHKQPRLLWCLPLIQLVWVNFHALFILGLVTGGCYAVDKIARELLSLWAKRPAADEGSFRLQGYVAIATVLACLINPYLDEGFLFPLELYRKFSVPTEQAFYSKAIGEFQRPIDFYHQVQLEARQGTPAQRAKRPSSPWELPYFVAPVALWCLTAGSFGLALAARLQTRDPSAFPGPGLVYRGMMFGLFSLLGWQATRNSNLFALVTATMLAANLADARWLFSARPNAEPTRLRAGNWPALAAVLMLCLAVVTGHWNQWMQEKRKFGLGERPHWFAHEACRFAGIKGLPLHAIVSHNGVAGVYSYHNGPDAKVFMDARLEVCRRETFELFLEILQRIAMGDTSWQQLPGMRDDLGRLPVLVMETRTQPSRMAMNGLLLNRQWRLIFADQAGAVFVEDRLAESLKLPRVRHEPLMYPPD